MINQCTTKRLHTPVVVFVCLFVLFVFPMMACNFPPRPAPAAPLPQTQAPAISPVASLHPSATPSPEFTPTDTPKPNTTTPDFAATTASAKITASQKANQTQKALDTATAIVEQALQDQAATLTAQVPTGSPSPTTSPSPTPTPSGMVRVDVFTSVVKIDDLLPGDFENLRIAPDGTAWVVSELGVASLSGNNWSVHFSDGYFLFAGFDANDRPWLVSGDGSTALKWNGSTWEAYGETEGWTAIDASFSLKLGEAMVTDLKGRSWITTFQDVRSFDGQKWKIYNLEDMAFEESSETAEYDGFALPAIGVDQTGNVWVGNCDAQGEVTVGQGARWFDGEEWHGVGSPVGSGCVWDIVPDNQGNIWLGADGILWRYKTQSGNWASYTPPVPPMGSRFGWISDIAIEANGDPWPSLAICGGASCGGFQVRYQIEGEDWKQIAEVGDYFDEQVFFDAEGLPWLYSEDTLYRVEGKKLEAVNDLVVQVAALDQEGRLWLVAEYNGQRLLWRQILGVDQ